MKIFLYSSSVYYFHLFLISSASVRSIPFLSFIVPIFAWNVPLVSLIFLKGSLVFPILLFESDLPESELPVSVQESPMEGRVNSFASDQTTGREHSPTHQHKIGLKIYWAWLRPSEQDPVSPTVSLSHQEASVSLLSLFIRGQTDWKPKSQKTKQSDHMDHSLV